MSVPNSGLVTKFYQWLALQAARRAISVRTQKASARLPARRRPAHPQAVYAPSSTPVEAPRLNYRGTRANLSHVSQCRRWRRASRRSHIPAGPRRRSMASLLTGFVAARADFAPRILRNAKRDWRAAHRAAPYPCWRHRLKRAAIVAHKGPFPRRRARIVG